MSTERPGVYYFADWPDFRFFAWLGGFFDGEGCVYMKPRRVGIEVSIVNTDLDVIHSIQQRLGYGEIAVLREAGDRHKKQLYWRVRKLHEVRRFLIQVRPYLTVKAERADRAITRIAESTRRQQSQRERYERIAELRQDGLSQSAIAARLGTTRSNIAQFMRRREPDRPLL